MITMQHSKYHFFEVPAAILLQLKILLFIKMDLSLDGESDHKDDNGWLDAGTRMMTTDFVDK